MQGGVASDEAGAVRHGAPLKALYIISFRQRDELAALAARAGWQVIAGRRADGAVQRYMASNANLAIVDARGALGEGLAAVAALGDTVATRGGALLVMVSRGDIGELPTFLEAGATHFLASPHTEPEFVQALAYAVRHAERLAGDWRLPSLAVDPLGWRFDPGRGTVVLTPALASLLESDAAMSPRALLGRLDPADRRQATAAVRRLFQGSDATAFAHDYRGAGRLVHHFQRDPSSGLIDVVVERLAPIGSAAQIVREALSSVRDAAGARAWIDRRFAAGARPIQAMLVSLSRFDIVNTAYGRAVGDGLLRTVHRRMADIADDQHDGRAIVARMGGSEFLIAVEENPGRIQETAGRIAETLSRPFVAGGAVAVLGSRIGIATSEPDDTSATLLRRAGEALAEARASDTLTISVAGRSANEGASLDTLSVDLRHALANDEIDILFQPQVSVTTGRIVGVEALARWEHPVMGALGAERLFAAAERAGLTIGLSDHIQRLVLTRAGLWSPVLSRLRLSLNLTASDIARPGFADIFLDRVDSSGFPRARLTVEITESGLINDLSVAADLLAQLRGAGCRVAIDDFGTGYSSLAYLKALPLDYLKIDKKLAQDITGSTRDRIVVRGVIDMARSLGLSVIAEGVETPEQLDLLAKEGCQIYQGFLCAEPLTEEALTALVGQ